MKRKTVGVSEWQTVGRHIPQHLRLHTEDPYQPFQQQSAQVLAQLQAACETFQQVTGWKLRLCASDQPVAVDACWSMPIGPEESDGSGAQTLVLSSAKPQAQQVHLDLATELARHLGKCFGELQNTRFALWQREAELATNIPITLRHDEPDHLAARLEAVLRGGAAAIGCQAAALYLLDDATTQLKLRADWGLPKQRYLHPARPLRGALADLEALVGHAVILEDTSLLPHWNAPEEFPSAVCVPVANSSTPLGTLWFFAEKVRDFDEKDTNLVEIIAGRLVADLEREVLWHHGLESQQLVREMHCAARWQRDRLPHIAPPLDGWQVAGRTLEAGVLGSSFYQWIMLEDGRLAVALGDVHGAMIRAGLTAASLLSAVKSHSAHNSDPSNILTAANQLIWTESAGDQYASLYFGAVDLDRGALRQSWAGQISALILGKDGYRVLADANAPLGNRPEAVFRSDPHEIQSGETLVIVSQGITEALPTADQTPCEVALAEAITAAHWKTADQLADVIHDLAAHAQAGDQQQHDRTILVIRRSEAP